MEQGLESLRIYEISVSLADEIWQEVCQWKDFEKRGLGRQLTEAADSVGANIAEGYGRYFFKDRIVFLYYARGSAFETQYWLERAFSRKLFPQEKHVLWMKQIEELLPQINGYIGKQREELRKSKAHSESPIPIS
jgi:four helix bundle protein